MPQKFAFSHSNRALSHFVEIGEVLNIETWHKGRLLLLESIVSEVKCECASVAAKVVRELMGLIDAIVFVVVNFLSRVILIFLLFKLH